MTSLLQAIGVAGFKGIGAETQFVTGLQKINFFVGENNAGKSTILQYISEYIGKYRSGEPTPKLADKHIHRGSRKIAHSFVRGIATGEFKNTTLERLNGLPSVNQTNKRQFSTYLDRIVVLLARNDYVWFKDAWKLNDAESLVGKAQIKGSLQSGEWGLMWQMIKPGWSGGDPDTWVSESLHWILQGHLTAIPVAPLIPAVRQIGEKGGKFSGYGGVGIIDQLAQMQNPGYNNRGQRRKFDLINAFLASVTGQGDATIEVPYDRDSILVHMNGRTLPIESLGTGIHEVLLLATFCTITTGSVVCIEEPELHLHPLLQRKLISHIQNTTDNQYFIATHSAAFIDTPGAAIYHVYLDGETTRVSSAKVASERYLICADLGCRASDIVQSNAVVWVEGPSDRLYIKHWIRALASELIEGTHYTIMFYGGRNLSHLTADDQAVVDFIRLRDLNRNMAVVIDSDCASDKDDVNSTKERIRREVNDGGGVVWITSGREIENYIDHGSLQAAVATVHPRIYGAPASGGPYDHALWFRRVVEDGGKRTVEKTVDKVAVAHEVCKERADLQILDLEERVGELVSMIRKANHLEVLPT